MALYREWMQDHGLDLSKVAVILETRPLPHLVPLILHTIKQLGPEWPFKIYYSSDNGDMVHSDPEIVAHIGTGKIVAVQTYYKFEGAWSWLRVNRYLAHPRLWKHLAPAKKVLFFQSDSTICSKSTAKIDDFMEYDFIGAPIQAELRPDNETFREGELWMNGGFSIRNRELIKDILDPKKHQWTDTSHDDLGQIYAKDQYFCKRIYELGGHLPTLEVAKTFGVETIPYSQPWSTHAPWKHLNGDDLAQVEAWCPEILLLPH